MLLFAMMVLNVNLRIAGFFHLVTSRVVTLARTPRRLLALVIAVSGVRSAIFLNDTIALMMTPLVLDLALTLRRNPLPYLVALVTAANVGSVAAITGNPQNMLVGLSSGISFLEFTLADPHAAWLTLAMATTLAGNLTLLGSVANLIVAEIAQRRGVRLSFVEYLKAGTPIAILTLLVGVAWLS